MFHEVAHSECPLHGAVIGVNWLVYREIISKPMKCSGAILPDLNGLGLKGRLGEDPAGHCGTWASYSNCR